MKRVGAVIEFDENVSEAEARRILDKINEVVATTVREYDDEYGDPVWYIP